jgi:hypothetical protein
MKPSLLIDIRAILEEKGLNSIYISDKMKMLAEHKTNLDVLAASRFLDENGRIMLAERIKFSSVELTAFYNVSSRFT